MVFLRQIRGVSSGLWRDVALTKCHIGWSLVIAWPVSAESYRDEKLRELSGGLRRSREILHRAHRGLAWNAALEEFLKRNEIEIPEEVASEHGDLLPNKNAERKLSDVISKIRDLEKRLIA